MKRFGVGDRVQIDITDKDDPDHKRPHRKHGTIIDKIEDDAGQETKDPCDSICLVLRWIMERSNISDGETFGRHQTANW